MIFSPDCTQVCLFVKSLNLKSAFNREYFKLGILRIETCCQGKGGSDTQTRRGVCVLKMNIRNVEINVLDVILAKWRVRTTLGPGVCTWDC